MFIATSLDGFIAREDGDVAWLTEDRGGEKGEDYGYQTFIDTVDVLVMGRGTYEKVLSFGAWPYKKPVVVLSTGAVAIPDRLAGSVEAMSASPPNVARRLAERGFRHAYIDGGKTIQGFLEAGLIQQMTLTTIPILIGKGLPLFGSLSRDVRLRHLETRSFPSGLVQSRYEVASDGA